MPRSPAPLSAGQPAYWSNGSSGSFSFTATGSPLMFEQVLLPEQAGLLIMVSGDVWYTVL